MITGFFSPNVSWKVKTVSVCTQIIYISVGNLQRVVSGRNQLRAVGTPPEDVCVSFK